MQPLDPRTVRSRQRLSEALVRLALSRGLEKLTVGAVCQLAKVGTTTFYRHYTGLDDLLMDAAQSCFQELKERISRQETLYDEALGIYTAVRDRPGPYRIYFELPLDHPVYKAISAEVAEVIRARVVQRADSEVPFEAAVEYVLQATHRLVLHYLDNLDRLTPEQMADMHYDLVLKSALHASLEVRPGWVLAPEYILRDAPDEPR